MKKTLKLSGRMIAIPANGELAGECEASPRKLTSNQIVDAIWNGRFSQDELHSINEAVRAAYRADRAERLHDAQYALHNGSVVMLKGIRPKRLIGMTGTIENFRPGATRADLRVTQANWNARYKKGDLVRGIPLTCFEAISKDVLERSGWTPEGD